MKSEFSLARRVDTLEVKSKPLDVPIRISRAMLGDSNCFTTSGHPGDLGLFGSIWAVLGHFEPLLSKIWLPKIALKILSKTLFGIHSMSIYKEIYLFNIKRESAD